MRREGTKVAIIVLHALVTLWAAPGFARDVQFEQAEQLKAKRKYDDAIPLYRAVIARPEADPDDRARSRWAVIDILRAQKKPAEALAEAGQLHDDLPADHWMKRQAAGAACDLLSQLERHDEAAALAARTAEAAADEREVAADWHMRCAYLLMRGKKYADAYEQGGKALRAAREADEHRRALDALWVQADAMYLAQDYEKCLVPLKAALDLKFDDVPGGQWLRVRQRTAECYTKLDRLADARAAYQSFLAVETDAPQRQRWWLAVARSWEAEKDSARAVAAYEQLIADRADLMCRDLWPEAQGSILRLTLQANDTAAALKALHLSLDLADSRDRIQAAAQQVLALLRKADGDPARARAFAAYQQFGRAGPDGRSGTPDDLADPLQSVGYPANPARAAAFEAAAAKLGADAAASLHRGWMAAYLGKPKEATAWFLDACRRGAGDDYQSAVHALLLVGARSATGSISDVERVADYVLHGPGGGDGKARLADPFAAMGLPPLPPAAALQPKDRATLVEICGRLATGLERGMWQSDMKADVVAALERVHGALGDWGAPGLADWYVARMEAEPAYKTQEAMLAGALAAARGGQAHMAGMRQCLARLDGDGGGKPVLRETARKAWRNWMQKIEGQTRTKSLLPRMKVN